MHFLKGLVERISLKIKAFLGVHFISSRNLFSRLYYIDIVIAKADVGHYRHLKN